MNRRLERRISRSRASSLGPMPDDIMSAARPVGDATVQRLHAEPPSVIADHQRVEAAPEPVDLDDVAQLDPLESHPGKEYVGVRRRGRLRAVDGVRRRGRLRLGEGVRRRDQSAGGSSCARRHPTPHDGWGRTARLLHPHGAGYTLGMKTAVSIPDPLFERADALARRLGKTRSQVYREALAEYVVRREPRAVTTALDDLVQALGPDIDPWVTTAARRALQRSEW